MMRYDIKNGEVMCLVDGKFERRLIKKLESFTVSGGPFDHLVTRPVVQHCEHELLSYTDKGMIVITTRME